MSNKPKPTELVEDLRPFDWQDKVVISGSIICCLVCIVLLWVPAP